MELRISLAGKGTLDNTPVPEPDAWQGFKTHPATSEVEYTDLRHLSSRKQFKRMIIPTDPQLTQVPTLQFSFLIQTPSGTSTNRAAYAGENHRQHTATQSAW